MEEYSISHPIWWPMAQFCLALRVSSRYETMLLEVHINQATLVTMSPPTETSPFIQNQCIASLLCVLRGMDMQNSKMEMVGLKASCLVKSLIF